MRATFVSLPFVLMLGGGCAQPPSAHIAARRLTGPRPAQVALRCDAVGVRGPREVRWKLAPGVRVVGGNVPQDEPQLLVTLPEPLPPAGVWAECTIAAAGAAAGSQGAILARATRSLVPPRIAQVMPLQTRANGLHELVTLRGYGFSPIRGNQNAIYFVAGRKAIAADHGCAGATWSDQAVSACVPAAVTAGEWQVRLQTDDALALAPAPLVVLAR
jgi:hypothetical protein